MIDLGVLLVAALSVAVPIGSGCVGEGCLAILGPFLFAPLATPVYSILLIHLRGQTVGMMAVGIRAQTLAGSHPGWGGASLRWLVGDAILLFPLFGWILAMAFRLPILWNERRQGLHDLAAGTLVVLEGVRISLPA